MYIELTIFYLQFVPIYQAKIQPMYEQNLKLVQTEG